MLVPGTTVVLRGAIVNRTYGAHKNMCCSHIITDNIWSDLPWPPVIVRVNVGRSYYRSLDSVVTLFPIAFPPPQKKKGCTSALR